MWRWQSLLVASRYVEVQRALIPNRSFILGLEWNPPGVDHASVGVLGDDPTAIAAFEYQFDRRDRSGSPTGDLEKMNGREAGGGELLSEEEQQQHALAALAWLCERHPRTSYVLPNHPERSSRYRVEDFRAWNDAAPGIVFGFESAPGHQKTSNRPRGYFRSDRAFGGSTYGGFGIMTAEVGGVWDALLGEGRDFWLFGNSDFHHPRGDFWPGAYSKTHVYADDTTSARAILDGDVTGRHAPGSPAYARSTNESTRIVAHLPVGDWKEVDGWTEGSVALPPSNGTCTSGCAARITVGTCRIRPTIGDTRSRTPWPPGPVSSGRKPRGAISGSTPVRSLSG